MQDRIAYQGITFDDVLLEPGYSEVLPREVDVRTMVTRQHPPQHADPVLADGHRHRGELAIALAQEGGIGVIHKNMSIDDQTREVDKVKRSENGIITDPITLPPDATVATAREIMERAQHLAACRSRSTACSRHPHPPRSAVPRPTTTSGIDEVMTKDNLVTAPANTTLEEAERILTENKVEKLLLVDEEYRLKGLITIKDIDKLHRFPNACKDARGRLRVGAAVGVHDYERAGSLIEAGVDVLVVDSAHGHSEQRASRRCGRSRSDFDIDVIAGNVATAEGAKALIDGRGRRGEGRHRTGLDLHDAGHLGRRRAADHGDLPALPRASPGTACRSSPTAASAIRATSPRRSPPGPTA